MRQLTAVALVVIMCALCGIASAQPRIRSPLFHITEQFEKGTRDDPDAPEDPDDPDSGFRPQDDDDDDDDDDGPLNDDRAQADDDQEEDSGMRPESEKDEDPESQSGQDGGMRPENEEGVCEDWENQVYYDENGTCGCAEGFVSTLDPPDSYNPNQACEPEEPDDGEMRPQDDEDPEDPEGPEDGEMTPQDDEESEEDEDEDE